MDSRAEILKVFDILKKYSDCDHHLNAAQIAEYILDENVNVERRAIYKDISALIECGYDVNKSSNLRSGYYYGEREFQLPEIRLLIDAIEGAPFITRKKTEQLKFKLLSFLSIYQSENLNDNIYRGERHKFTNEEIYYNIDTINEAIKANKKITFTYYHKLVKNGKLSVNDGRKFTVSPYGLFWLEDRYYLAANYDKYDNIANYRIDRMKKVVITEQNRREVAEVYNSSVFDISEYVGKSVQAFSGEASKIKLKIDSDMLDIVTDKFGDEIELVKKGKTSLDVMINVNISEGLVNWLLPYSKKISVIYPDSLKRSINEKIKDLYDHIK